MRIADLLPLPSNRATFSTTSAGTRAGATSGSRSAARSARPHAQSAGTINVATPPGAARAACTARAASPATELALRDLPHPGRDRARDADHVGGQRRVIADVIDRVIADDVDNRRRRPARIVQIGEAVGEAGAEMQQRRGRLAGDPAVAVGGAGRDALEQAQHAAQTRIGVERADQMHLGSAGIGEANLDATIDQRLRECLRAVHIRAPSLALARAL